MKFSTFLCSVKTTLNIVSSTFLFVQMQALNKKLKLMGQGLKFISKKLLDDESLSVMVL